MNDIAIVQVKSDGNSGIRFNSYVRPLCLPPSNATYEPGMNCTITGWGASTNHHGSSSKFKSIIYFYINQIFMSAPVSDSSNSFHPAVVKLLSNFNCKLKHPKLTSGVVCASSQKEASFGSGDAGWGLVCDVQGAFKIVFT